MWAHKKRFWAQYELFFQEIKENLPGKSYDKVQDAHFAHSMLI